MKPKSEQSKQLYQYMVDKGYPADFSDLVTKNLNADFTASRVEEEERMEDNQ